MRLATLVLSVLASLSIHAQRHQTLTPDAIQAEAAGCVLNAITCGGSVTGEIAAGDCVFPDGHRYDTWWFNAFAGQFATVTLTATEASLVNPSVTLVPPTGDASVPPILSGTPNVPIVLKYRLATPGLWQIVVSTGNLTAGGKYQISLSCGPEDSGPQGCIDQHLACEQVLTDTLGATGCEFSDGIPYGYATVSLTKGDYVKFDASSSEFDPTLSIFLRGGTPLASSYGKRLEPHATVFFTAPSTDSYQAAVYAVPAASGAFTLAFSCINGCTAPVITTHPRSQTVPYGGTVTLSVAAAPSNGNVASYSWYRIDGLPSYVDSGPTLTVRNVTATQHYYALATNACGEQISATATITPRSRGRAIRH
jgi:hypothetical protein